MSSNDEMSAIGPAAEVEAGKPSRFAWGLALGIGIGAIAVSAVLAAGYFGTMYYMRRTVAGPAIPSAPLKSVDAGEWFVVDAEGKGTMTGFSSGGGSGDDASEMAAWIDLTAGSVYKGVVVRHSVRMYVTKDTKLTVGGKPWTQAAEKKSLPELLFSEPASPIDGRELTIRFRKVGNRLVADSIDGSSEEADGPPPWEE